MNSIYDKTALNIQLPINNNGISNYLSDTIYSEALDKVQNLPY